MMMVNSFNEDTDMINNKIEGVSYSIEIRDYAMKILFTLLKNSKAHSSSQSLNKNNKDLIKEINPDFIDDICYELKKCMSLKDQNPEKFTMDDMGTDIFKYRMTEVMSKYCITILTFIIQFWVKETDHKLKVGDTLIKFLAYKIFLNYRQAFTVHFEKQKKVKEDDSIPSVIIPIEFWRQGILGEEIEKKFFKLLVSLTTFSSHNANIKMLKTTCDIVFRQNNVPKETSDVLKEFFSNYSKSTPRTIIKQACIKLSDLDNLF